MTTPTAPAEGFPPNCELIEVHLTEVKQLFHSLDPTPFRERDLDPKADEFIAGWARELRPDIPLGLLVHLDQPSPSGEDLSVLREAVREYFHERASETRRHLRHMLRVGRTSLMIGLVFLAASVVASDLVGAMLSTTRFGAVVREGFLIGGWVAMWRPLEVFLYDWWPIRSEARLFDRLSRMTVRIVQSVAAKP